jgi:carbon-monoxide dehydrogenase large subunit
VKASRELVERALDLAAEALEASGADLEWIDGAAQVQGAPERSLSLGQIAQLAAARTAAIEEAQGAVDSTADGAPPSGTDRGRGGPGRRDCRRAGGRDDVPGGGRGGRVSRAYIALVSIDRDTGRLSVERFVAVDDCGVVINPMLVEGQVHGSLAQGFGEALWERMVYDADGQVLTGSLMDYALPAAMHLGPWITGNRVTPSPVTPLGQKGAGEAGTIGAPPALINAVLDALAPLGVTHVDMPLTDEQLWRLISSSELRGARDE